MPRILAIETSCDETAAAVVAEGRVILSNIVASQAAKHAQYGGVFPEVASRMHIEVIYPVIEQALAQAHVGLSDLDAIGVTRGPGLPGSLVVGLNVAKGLALGRNLPLIGVNHLEGHVYSLWLVDHAPEVVFPVLVLIVSGGHTELILMTGHAHYQRLGGTLDDAAGEAFDKTAKLLGLPYPGGPALSQLADAGRPKRFHLPRPMLRSGDLDFSFSGLKTAVLMLAHRQPADDQTRADIAAAFQEAIVEVLVNKSVSAVAQCGLERLVVAGGVGANRQLREALNQRADTEGFEVFYPPLDLCTDNGAMIAYAGALRLQAGAVTTQGFNVRARWDLASLPAAGKT